MRLQAHLRILRKLAAKLLKTENREKGNEGQRQVFRASVLTVSLGITKCLRGGSLPRMNDTKEQSL